MSARNGELGRYGMEGKYQIIIIIIIIISSYWC